MDDLYSCYQSYMRLYPDDPDRLTLGRWLWCPEGAEALPFPTAFCSSRYDPNDWQLEGVGEISEIAGYSSGRGNPRYTGRTHCGSAYLFASGSPVMLRGTPPVDADGVPLCCDAPPAVGGEALGGAGAVVSSYSAIMWLQPESLASYTDGDPVSTWADTALTAPAMNAGLTPPVKETDPSTGLAVAVIPPGSEFSRPVSLNLGSAYSIYLVGGAASGPARDAGPWLIAGAIGTQRVFRVINHSVDFRTAGYSLIAPFSQATVAKHLYSVRADTTGAAVAVDGVTLATETPGPGGVVLVGGLSTAVITLPQTRYSWTGEVLIFPTKLTDAQDAMVQRHLCNKWLLPFGDPEVPTGSIVHMATAATPPGYLPCDGSAYASADFPELTAYLAGVYDTYRGAVAPGVGQFRVPDLRGLVLVGGGETGVNPTTSAYTLGVTGGEESHTLDTAELPNHTHAITTSGDPGGVPGFDFKVYLEGVTAVDAAPATAATGGGAGHNNLQPFGVGFPFIKT
jgi:microcystin-dependent protein